MAVPLEPAVILEALKSVMDPDLGQNIVELDFIKNLEIDGGRVSFSVELTTPACPVKEQLRKQSEEAVKSVPGVHEVRVRMTARTRGAPRVGGGDALAGVKNLVAVASAKGGVGKSTCTVNLAYALAQSGARVGILDADIHGPSMVHMTGVGVPEESSGGLMRPPSVDGIRVISMAMFIPNLRPTLLRGPRLTAIISQFLNGFDWGELDYLLIDYPPGTGDIQMALAQMVPITGAVVITTPQEVAMIDVRRSLSMFKVLEVPVLGIVENMSGFLCGTCGTLHPIFSSGGGQRLCEEFGLSMLGQIPLDPSVVMGGETGVPVAKREPTGATSKAYREAAGQIAARLSVRHAESGGALDSFQLTWEDR